MYFNVLILANICPPTGCKPVIAHYEKWAKKNCVLPAIDMVMKDMGMPQHAKVQMHITLHHMLFIPLQNNAEL